MEALMAEVSDWGDVAVGAMIAGSGRGCEWRNGRWPRRRGHERGIPCHRMTRRRGAARSRRGRGTGSSTGEVAPKPGDIAGCVSSCMVPVSGAASSSGAGSDIGSARSASAIPGTTPSSRSGLRRHGRFRHGHERRHQRGTAAHGTGGSRAAVTSGSARSVMEFDGSPNRSRRTGPGRTASRMPVSRGRLARPLPPRTPPFSCHGFGHADSARVARLPAPPRSEFPDHVSSTGARHRIDQD